MRFLEVLGTRWNITLFHYRTDGADYGRVLTAFEAGPDDIELTEHMDRLGYAYHEETNAPLGSFLSGPLISGPTQGQHRSGPMWCGNPHASGAGGPGM